MADFGTLCLYLALATCGWAILVSYNGWRAASGQLILSGERATYATWGLVTLAVLALEYCILTDQFDLEYVASYSNRALPVFYKISALWAGQSGSLLFWVFVLASYAAVVVRLNRQRNRPLMPVVVITLAAISAFFLMVICFMAHPFTHLGFTPVDGRGMNPQLQNPFMTIHPPCLYVGYVGLSVPFAFAVAALATGKLNDTWFRTTRRFTVISWFTLGIGILLGCWWAYLELGWGGYWAWDPVENASLIPWLTCTAFLHSVMIEERKKMLRLWNMSLVIMSFLLAILGTFITRSGVISSVHSFAKSEIGPFFAAFLGLCALVSIGLLLYRSPLLTSSNRLDSFVSRESTFLLNNLVLVGAAFAVLWGTIFPILSEAVRGAKITVGAPFFNQVMIPLTFGLLALSGICPIVAWRRATPGRMLRKLNVPLWSMVACAAALLGFGIRDVYAVTSFSLSAFVIATTFLEFHWGTRARQRTTGEPARRALFNLVARNKRRYGGFVVHVGAILIIVGITGSSAFRQESTTSLIRGESFSLGRYSMTFEDTVSEDTPNHEFFGARLAVRERDRRVGTLIPGQNFYKAGQDPSSEIDIHHTLRDDLYLILLGFDPQRGEATLKAHLTPLINWIWIGGGVLLLGSCFALLPDLRERRRGGARLLREGGAP